MDFDLKIDWHSDQSHTLLNPRLPEQEQKRLLELSETYAKKAHIWIASSGSSASADQSVKLIALSKLAFLAAAEAANRHVKSDSKDVWIQVLPHFHVGGLSIETRAYLSGAKVVPGLENGKWNHFYFHKVITEQKGSLASLVPTQVFDLVQSRLKAPASMKAIVVGGGALETELYHRAVDLGWPLLPSYGMTECCSQVATAPLDSWKTKNRDLKFLSHVEGAVTAEGFLKIKSPSLLTGFARWEKNQKVWKDPKENGWYQSEDRVEIKNGFLYPLGRSADFVKIRGEGVQLLKLQSTLEKISQEVSAENWKNFAVIAFPDPRAGHLIGLVFDQKTDKELVHKVAQKFNSAVAPFERIENIYPIDEIPRTALGKLIREKLMKVLN